MAGLSLFAPQLLAAFMDAASMATGGVSFPPYLDESHSHYHLTTHEIQPDGTAHGTVNFACAHVTARFKTVTANAVTPRMQQRMQDNINLVEMLKQEGPLTIADPHAVLNKGYIINTMKNYLAKGFDEESAQKELARSPYVQQQLIESDPAYHKSQAQQAGRPYLARITIGCG